MVKIITYPLVLLWTAFCAILGLLMSVVLRLKQFTLYLVPGRLWAPVLFFLMGIKIKSSGQQNIDPYTPSIFVVNHGSFLDIPASAMEIPLNLYYIVKKELKKAPFIGWYITATDHIYVDRKNKEAARESMRIAAERINKGKHVLAYPEGTRSKDDSVRIFRRGSFIIAKNGDIPIIPVGITGAHDCLPPGKFWWKKGTIEVIIGEPIRPSDHPDSGPEDLAEMARQAVIALREQGVED